MYAKCGALAKAKEVLEGLPSRNVVLWNALIAGFAQGDNCQEAVNCFDWMCQEGLSPDVVTYASVLKACGRIKALDKGKQIHFEVVKQGMVGENVILGGALVDMYAKCGAFQKAKQVLEGLPVRNAVIWNALIAGYIQAEQVKEVFSCFERMQYEGLFPNASTFVSILKACGTIGALDKGKAIHSEIARQSLLSGNSVLGGALVDMYVKCGALERAREVIKGIAYKSVVTWNSLIAGYVQGEHCWEALNCFEQMECDGLSPDVVTFVCILRACGSAGALDKGKAIHVRVVKQGLLGENTVLGNALLDMYVKCCALAQMKELIEELSVRDVVSWSALITGYAQGENCTEALNCFEHMQHEGLAPDAVTFACVLKVCGSSGALGRGKKVHSVIVMQRLLGKDYILGAAVVDMYVKCSALAKAKDVLEGLPVRYVTSWNSLITGYVDEELGEEALYCSELMLWEGLFPDEVTFVSLLKACSILGALDKGEEIHCASQGLLVGNVVLGNALVDMYVKCGAPGKAEEVFEELSIRNIISWNALMMGYVQGEDAMRVLDCFERVLCEGLSPDVTMLACVLKVCSSLGAFDKGETMHLEIVKQGLLGESVVLDTALLDMYAKCGAFVKANYVLEGLPVRNVVSWNALISGYAHKNHGKEAFNCFECMQYEGLFPDAVTFACCLKACGSIGALDKGERLHYEIEKSGLLCGNVVLGNALVDMYVKCSALSKAKEVFDALSVRNVISWNTLISGCVQEEREKEALDCFEEMHSKGLSPDESTFACALKACSGIGALDKGYVLHSEIVRQGLFGENLIVDAALVDMYAKCGALLKAKEVLDGLPVRDVVSWSALITGYAQGDHGKEALCCFEQMQLEGLVPDDTTFLCLLSACSHSDLLSEAISCFMKMTTDYGIVPTLPHKTCMAYLLGHIGLLDMAIDVIKKLPSPSYPPVWFALLSACKESGNIDLGTWVFENSVLSDLSPLISDVYTSKLCAAEGEGVSLKLGCGLHC